MATDISINVNTNIEDAEKEITNLSRALRDAKLEFKNLQKGTDEYVAAQKNIEEMTKALNANKDALEDMNKTSEKNVKSMQSIKREMRDAASALANMTAGTPEYVAQAEKVGQLRDQINELNDSIRNTSGAPVENLTSSFGMLGGQVQSLDFEGAALSVRQFSAGASSLDFKTLTNGAGEFAKSLGGMAKAILSNPIFLIAGVVIAVGAAFVALKDKLKIAHDVFEALGAAMDWVTGVFTKLSDAIFGTTFAAEEAAQKQIDAAKKTGEAINERYDREIKLASASGKSTTAIETKKAREVRKNIDDQINAILKLSNTRGFVNDEEKKQIEELGKLRKASLLDEEVSRAKAYQELVKSIQETQKAQAEEAKKKAEERKKNNDAIAADNKKLLQQIKDEQIAAIKDEETRAIAKADEDRKRRDADIRDSKASADIKRQALAASELQLQTDMTTIKDAAEAKRKEAEDKRIAEIQANNKMMSDKASADLVAQGELKVLQSNANAEMLLQAQKEQNDIAMQIALANTDMSESQQSLIKEQFRIKNEELDKQYRERKMAEDIQIGADTFAGLQGLSDMYFAIQEANTSASSENAEKHAKKQFQINKSLQLGTAVINGLQSILAITSVPDFTLGAATALRIGAQIATTAGVVAKIAATQYKSSGSAATAPKVTAPSLGGSAGGETPKSALPNIESKAFDTSTVNNVGLKPERVYVVESDITSKQRKVATTESLATV